MPSKTMAHLWVSTRFLSVNSIGHFVYHKYFIGNSRAVLRTKSKQYRQAAVPSTATERLYGVYYVPRHSNVLLSTIWNKEKDEEKEGKAKEKNKTKQY
jgi:hypothetical protein